MGSDRLHFTQKEEGRVGVCVWWQRWDRRRQKLSGRTQGASDSACMEARVDSRQVTGAGTTKLAATDVPGVERERGLDALRHWPEVRARSSGRAAPDARSVCYSLRIGEEDRTELARGGLSGNPAPRERAERGWTLRAGCPRGVPCRRAVDSLAGQTLSGDTRIVELCRTVIYGFLSG